jgi:hypothetical protein
MRKLLLFLFGMIVGGGLMWFAFRHHLVYAKDGLTVVSKRQASLSELYVDIRNWKPADWQAHPQLVYSLIASGRNDLINAPSSDLLREMLRKFGNAEKERDDYRTE